MKTPAFLFLGVMVALLLTCSAPAATLVLNCGPQAGSGMGYTSVLCQDSNNAFSGVFVTTGLTGIYADESMQLLSDLVSIYFHYVRTGIWLGQGWFDVADMGPIGPAPFTGTGVFGVPGSSFLAGTGPAISTLFGMIGGLNWGPAPGVTPGGSTTPGNGPHTTGTLGAALTTGGGVNPPDPGQGKELGDPTNGTNPADDPTGPDGGFPPADCTPTPEPASMVLMGAGLVGIAAVRRRRK